MELKGQSQFPLRPFPFFCEIQLFFERVFFVFLAEIVPQQLQRSLDRNEYTVFDSSKSGKITQVYMTANERSPLAHYSEF